MNVLITGATGFVGFSLVGHLALLGHHGVVLSRCAAAAAQRAWPAGTHVQSYADPLPAIDAVVHLAGEPVVGCWTHKKRAAILSSRAEGTRRLVEKVCALPMPPTVFLSASAVGYYGHRPGELLDETSAADPAHGFRSLTCVAWEGAARTAERCGMRAVMCRFGTILAPHGGFFARMLPVWRRLPIMTIGDPSAMQPWVSLTDVLRLIGFALENAAARGPINVTSPHPVTQKEFTATVARCLGKRVWGAIPPWLLRMTMGDLSGIFCDSQHVVSRKANDLGFTFTDPILEPFLRKAL